MNKFKTKIKNMKIPNKIKLKGYGEIIEFCLTNKRENKYYGKTKISNETLWRVDKLKDNEVFYQTKWGWGVIVDIDKMETVSYDNTEWGGQKIYTNIEENKNMKQEIDLRKCKEGDLLISSQGAKLLYIRPTYDFEYLDHYVQYLEMPDGTRYENCYGTRTHDGLSYPKKPKPETDNDIVEIIPREEVSPFHIKWKVIREEYADYLTEKLGWKVKDDGHLFNSFDWWLYEVTVKDIVENLESFLKKKRML